MTAGTSLKAETSQNTCKNCQHKRCILHRRIASVAKIAVKGCDRATIAVDELVDAVEEKIDAIAISKQEVDASQNGVDAAIVFLQTQIDNQKNALLVLQEDIDALKNEIQRPSNVYAGSQAPSHAVPSQRKRKTTDEGSPFLEIVINGNGRTGRGHGRKLSKVGSGLPSRHVTPSQCTRE